MPGNFSMSITFVFAPNTIIRSAQMNTNLLQDIRDKYNASLDGTTGHGHTGAVGDGPKINLTTSVTGVLPVANGGSGTATVFTTGSVIFAGPSGTFSQDNANFFWDNTNNFLGIGTTTPDRSIHATGDIHANGILINGGFDFVLGNFDQATRGNSGNSRALVKFDSVDGSRIHLNFENDFPGGVAINNGTVLIATNGEILLPAFDPPTPNYSNRNSMVKAWADIASDGTINNSFNVSSVIHVGTGVYTVNWNIDFSSANYSILLTGAGTGGGEVVATEKSGSRTAGSVSVSTVVPSTEVPTNTRFSILAIGSQ